MSKETKLISSQRERLQQIAVEMRNIENVEVSGDEDLRIERNRTLTRIWVALSLVLRECVVPLVEICRILELEPEIDKRRKAVVLRIANIFTRKFPDFDQDIHIPIQYERVAQCFVPPDSKEVLSGEGEYIKPGEIRRDQYIEEVLCELGIHNVECNGSIGVNLPGMMRSLSYQLIVIAELEKMILFCNEEGNRTFVRHGICSAEEFYSKKKSELKVDEDVEDLQWCGDPEVWKSKLKVILQSEDYRNPRAREKPSEDGLIELEDGRMRTIREEDLEDDGTIFIVSRNSEGELVRREAAVPVIYIDPKTCDPTIFKKLIIEAGLTPIPNVECLRCSKRVPLYWKEDLDRITPRYLRDDRTYIVDGRLAVSFLGFQALCKAAGLNWTTTRVRKLMDYYHIKPIPLNFRSGKQRVEMYFRDEMDAIMPVRLASGETMLQGEIWCSPTVYAKVNSLYIETVLAWFKGSDIVPHPILGYGGNKEYLKSDIDKFRASLGSEVSSDGYAEVNGRIAINLERVGGSVDYPFSTEFLHKCVKEAGVMPIEGIKFFSFGSGSQPSKMFWKDELDQILPKKLDQDTGIVTIDGREYVGLNRYAVLLGINVTKINNLVIDSGISPYSGPVLILSGRNNINVYPKHLVDALIAQS